ncbi:hypothetical protein J7L70_06905 [Candidatus Bathyarchaeota archaeon]|nr:hypothetical protein [Candidatus Bathyarchaeota archaeon]
MLGREVALALLMLAAAALVTVYTVMQTAPEPDTETSTGSSTGGSTGGGAILPVSSDVVPSIEEAARALNASGPVRLPTRIPANMTYVRMIYSSDSDTIYVFYADEPIAEEDNPFVLMHMLEGWTFDVEGGAPDMMIIIHRLDPEAVALCSDINTEEVARERAEQFNLTYRMVDGIAVFGYDPVECELWSEPIGTVHFYVDDLVYQIRSHLSYEEAVEIARSIIEQF